MADQPQPTDDAQANLYPLGAGADNEYTLVPGVCVLPLAELPPTDPDELKAWSPVVSLALHAPFRRRVAAYRARKTGAPPVVPSPGDTGKFLFTAGTVTFAAPVMNATSAAFDWEVIAEYEYVEDCVSRTRDGFVLGSPPWTWATQQENAAAVGGVPAVDSPGAVAAAGLDARVGYAQAQAFFTPVAGLIAGLVPGSFFYNTPSFFPGQLFNDELMNGGEALTTEETSVVS